jgi:hypothetical protein
MLIQLGLVSEAPEINFSDLTQASAAVQKQISRDFTPIWNVDATLDAFAALEDVPVGYWPIIVRNDIGQPGAAGIHLDKDGQPFALVQVTNRWQLTVSHEVLEMLADPFGSRLVAGKSIHPDQGRVEYLVEVCDPSEDIQFGYSVNGITVSDFYTPSFFDPVTSAGTRYSFTAAIPSPRTVLENGYLSWHDPVTDHWWQQTFFDGTKTFRDLGVIPKGAESLREQIDRLTPRPEVITGLPAENPFLLAAAASVRTVRRSTSAKADAWHAQIEVLKKKYQPGATGSAARA